MTSSVEIDIDGVLVYPTNPEYTTCAQNMLVEYITKNSIDKLVFNSVRGISFWNNKSLINNLQEIDDLNTVFIGNNGAFGIDVKQNNVLYRTPGIAEDTIEKIMGIVGEVGLREMTEQNDSSLYSVTQAIEKSNYDILKANPWVYWDNGYPNSDRIYKIAFETPDFEEGHMYKKMLKKLYKRLEESGVLEDCVLLHSKGLIEMCQRNYNKYTGTSFLLESNYWDPGESVLVVGDSPFGMDSSLLYKHDPEQRFRAGFERPQLRGQKIKETFLNGILFKPYTNYPYSTGTNITDYGGSLYKGFERIITEEI